MASDVDICNLALSHLGDEAQVAAIDPPDGSEASAQCGRFYPMVRSLLLEMHPWTFATKRAALAQVENPSPDDWQFAYTLPSTCIRPLAALTPGMPERAFGLEADTGGQAYAVEAGQDGTPVLFTDVETAVLRYIDNVTDSTKYTPGFVAALARLLASYLAGPILKGDAGVQQAQNQMKLFAVEYGRATAVNANTGKRTSYQTFQPSWAAGRGTPLIPEPRILR